MKQIASVPARVPNSLQRAAPAKAGLGGLLARAVLVAALAGGFFFVFAVDLPPAMTRPQTEKLVPHPQDAVALGL